MLKKLADIQVKSTIKNLGNQTKTFIPWQNIHKIALVLNHSQNVNKSAIDKFVSKHQKFVEVYFIEETAKAATYADWQSIIKTDLNLLKLPKSTFLKNLNQKKYDLVINTCDENDRIAKSITTAIQANYKCGAFDNFSQTNLVIKKNEPFSLIDYLEETIKYLKMIHN